MEKLKLLFIVNPISGIGKQKQFEKILDENIDTEKYDVEVRYTQYAGHASVIVKEAREENFYAIVAVGGDGSINEVARQLAGTETAFAVVPCGSGNGLARFLKIPLDPAKAIQYLNKAVLTKVDTCTVNDKFFISIAGAGFDSEVALKFAQLPGRGFITYFKAVTGLYFKYRPVKYKFTTSESEFEESALLVTVCNSDQYGFDFKIAPGADIQDGMLEVSIVKKVPLWRIPFTLIRVVTGKAYKSKYFKIIKTPVLTLSGNNNGNINLDGETVECKGDLKFIVHKLNLKMLICE